MTEAQRWLSTRSEAAPADLRTRMLDAVATQSGDSTADVLAAAALLCMQRALRNPAERFSALELLAADALLTHACEAAAEAGPAALAAFTDAWGAARFEQLLPTRVP